MKKFSVTIGESLLKYNYAGGPRPKNIPQRRNLAVFDLSFSAQLFGGYWAASFGIDLELSGIDDVSELIGADISIWDDSGQESWNGFVDSVSVSKDAATIQVGPVLAVSNFVQLVYREYSWNVNPPVYNGDKVYPPSDDNSEWLSYNTRSIRNWGQMFEVVSAGREMSDTEASQAAGYAIAERSEIQTSCDISTTGSTDSVRVECMGYFHLTKKRYVDFWDGGTYPANEVFQVAMGTMPIIYADRMEPCQIDLPLWNDDRQSLYDFLDASFRTLGDNSMWGYSFGIYENRIVRLDRIRSYKAGIYDARPTEPGPMRPIEPDFYISAVTGIVTDLAGREMPGHVRPGAWVQTLESPGVGGRQMDDMFIAESVEYTDDRLVINRMKFSLLDRALQNRGI